MLITDPETGEVMHAQTMLDPQRRAAMLQPIQTAQHDRLMEMLNQMEGAISNKEMAMLEQLADPSASGLMGETRRQMMLEELGISSQPERPLNNFELNMSMRAGDSVEDIEAEQIELSYNTTGVGGRIVEHQNGALEWVPNGPGDIPQPPIGDVFYDPIAEEQRRIQIEERTRYVPPGATRKFAKGGAVKRFQNGGLAEAVVPDPLEEVMDTDTLELEPMAITASDPPPGGLRELARLNRESAIERLEASRQALAARREARQREDETAKWLALAQGMLAPTRTGAFGENIGMAAEALRDETAARREFEEMFVREEANLLSQEGAIEAQYLNDLMNAARIEKTTLGEYGRRRPIGTAQLYTHPEVPEWLARGQAYHDPDKINPDGSRGGPVIEWLETTPDGGVARAMHQLDVERRGQLELIEGITKGEVDRANDDIAMGREAHDLIGKYERALYLLDRVGEGPGTGGWVNLMQHMSEWLGDTSETVSDLGELRNLLGRQVLDGVTINSVELFRDLPAADFMTFHVACGVITVAPCSA